jgi:WD40 repeat protein
MRVLQGRGGKVHGLAFAAGGRRLVTAGGRGVTVAVWDLDTGQVRRLRGHAGRVRCVGVDPGGRLLASADATGRLIVRALEDDGVREKGRAEGFHAVEGIAFAPGGGWLAAGGRRLYVWDLVSGLRKHWHEGGPVLVQLLASLGFTRARSLLAVAFTPDGQLFAWSRRGVRAVHLRDVASGRELDRLPAGGAVPRLAFAPNGRTLAAVTGRSVTLWDVAGRKVHARLTGHDGPPFHVAFSPDGGTLATAGRDGTVRFWDAAAARERHCFAWGESPVRVLAFAPDGLTCAAGTDSGQILVWDVE